MSAPMSSVARRALPLLDLTNLNEDCDETAVERLCAAAVTPAGPVAAVCIYPEFVEQAADLLEATSVRVATVANFPEGVADPAAAARETAAAFAAGADEVDVVAPWHSLQSGDGEAVGRVLAACVASRPPGGVVKAILETGELNDVETRLAAETALGVGVDFLKTSTGMQPIGATLDAVEVLIGEISRAGLNVGVKASGGVRTTADAASYLAIADQMMGPHWVSPETFRFGASGLLRNLLDALETD
ncbi:MAG: deoxyribose-phosphate aldolase [Rhodobacteraceae bacterium]|nr:deoxyribose-phosphate aldolase [Paracoccaceae bacterium]